MPEPTEKEKRENELRLVAAIVIHELWEAKNVSQLTLLKMQCDASLKDISDKEAKHG